MWRIRPQVASGWRWQLTLLVLTGVFVAIGVPTAGAQDAERLTERAQAFWELRVEGDYRAQYAYLEPRARGRITLQQYARGGSGGAIEYLGAQVEGTKIQPPWGVAKVRVLGRVLHPAMRGQPLVIEQVVDDLWLWVDGQWYRVVDPPAKLPIE